MKYTPGNLPLKVKIIVGTASFLKKKTFDFIDESKVRN